MPTFPPRDAAPTAPAHVRAPLRTFESDLLGAMLESVPANLVFADRSHVIRFANAASHRTLRRIPETVPLRAGALVGQGIDVFHSHARHYRALLDDPERLPHRTIVQLGLQYLELVTTAVFDLGGDRLGTMLTWDLVTQRMTTTPPGPARRR